MSSLVRVVVSFSSPIARIRLEDEGVLMRRFRLASAIAILATGLRAQTSVPVSSKDEPSDSLCVISGRVVTAAEGNPLKSARVSLRPDDSKPNSHPYAVTSDSDGHFVLKDVPPGRYHLVATRQGFVDQSYLQAGTQTEVLLGLKPGQKMSDVLFRMRLAAVITGHVTNDDGEEMVRAQVVAMRRPSEDEFDEEGPSPSPSHKRDLSPAASTRTDDRGQYRIFGLSPGEYYVRAVDSLDPDPENQSDWQDYEVREYLGSEYAPVYYPGVTQASQAEVIAVKAGDEVQANVLMQRMKTVEVAGRVMGPNGPAKDTYLRLDPPGADNYGADRGTSTDEKGNFRLKGIAPGPYVVTAYQRDGGSGDYEQRGRQKIEVAGENIDSLTIPLGGGASFRGRVTVAGAGSVPFDRIVIDLVGIDADEQHGGFGRVKNDGTFEIASVPEGDYSIRVMGLESDWYVKSVRFGADDVLEKGLAVESGSAGGTLVVAVSSATAQIEGSVSDGDKVIIGARVRIAPDPETPYVRFHSQRTSTDQSGHFSVTGLAPGKYRVISKSPALPGSDPLKSDPQMVTLSEHDHKTVDLVIPKPKTD